jgi:hypothetical protein
MNKDDVTIVMATSILPNHPNTDIIDETISAIRYHFPNNEIIMQIDGLRREQQHRKADYDEYKNRILWKCLHEYKNVLPIIFKKHSHQTTMMRRTIDLIETPLLLYVEGDAPLTVDNTIDWQKCLDLIESETDGINISFGYIIPKKILKDLIIQMVVKVPENLQLMMMFGGIKNETRNNC